eukprot:gene14725-biopygen2102
MAAACYGIDGGSVLDRGAAARWGSPSRRRRATAGDSSAAGPAGRRIKLPEPLSPNHPRTTIPEQVRPGDFPAPGPPIPRDYRICGLAKPPKTHLFN